MLAALHPGLAVAEFEIRNSNLELNRHGVAIRFAERLELPHGIAGDDRHLFVTEPFRQRVVVLDRWTGAPRGELPVPTAGFGLPFGARIERPGRLVVLDSGGFPQPDRLAIPSVHVYDYATHDGVFSASLVRSLTVPVPVVFTEDIEVIGPGRYVISDSGFGALWVIEPHGAVVPGIVPRTLDPRDALAALGPCVFPTGATVGGLPFRAHGDFAPGVGAMATDGTHLYMSGTCRGGVSRVRLDVLADARAPWERAADIEDVFVRPPGEVGQMKGLTVVASKSGAPQLYALESFNLRLVRIDVATALREILFDHEVLFNFPVTAAMLPLPGAHELVVASDQEHRLTALNAALAQDLVELPFVLTKVVIRPTR